MHKNKKNVVKCNSFFSNNSKFKKRKVSSKKATHKKTLFEICGRKVTHHRHLNYPPRSVNFTQCGQFWIIFWPISWIIMSHAWSRTLKTFFPPLFLLFRYIIVNNIKFALIRTKNLPTPLICHAPQTGVSKLFAALIVVG
jgi:hypothetical protein